ncbi:BACON domain-containing protein [Chitinophaga sp. Cy-1792]|uniref:BACON domain-containing protein n=1 Tax=Chitinophaga sp. Cy-1792 TaxID=2608339 RepID=UPI00141F2094|nr:BACON domain-containing protein [Chitinophaga sp. Cy-1792]NIG55650.1 BACON domain-containing protein [Chitinophaga sp. Cy-1792]
MCNLNRYTKIILAGLCVLSMATACRKDNQPVKPAPSAFTASIKNGGTFTAAGGKDTVVITAGTDGWWVTIPGAGTSWCTVTQTYGAGNFLLPVTIAANTTGAPRQVVITLNPSYNLPKVDITLNQSN